MSSVAQVAGPSASQQRSAWCQRIFTACWVGYAGFYFCRKNIPWTPIRSSAASHAVPHSLVTVLLVFGLGYTAGQFAGGSLADRFGSRRTLLAGGVCSALCTAALAIGFPSAVLIALQCVNGLAQGLGWPAINRLFRAWIPGEERAIAMAWWCSSYALGGFLATAVATALSTISVIPMAAGSRLALVVPATVLLLTTTFAVLRIRETPEQAGLGSVGLESATAARPTHSESRIGYQSVLRHPELRLLALVYFFLKMMRYALLFWLPSYLLEAVHLPVGRSLIVSSFFELTGFFGALAACYASDRLLGSRRYAVGATMLFLAAFVLLLYPLAATLGAPALAVASALLGMLVYGPDLLLMSASVIDIVPLREAGRASGFVNGVGSLGQMLSPVLVTMFARWFGWNSIFNLFVVCTLISASLLMQRWDQSTIAADN